MDTLPETSTRTTVAYTHAAMADFVMMNPRASREEIARHFGYKNTSTISTILNTDAFKALLAERKKELVDPLVTQSIEEGLKVVAQLSVQRMAERLGDIYDPPSEEFVLKSAELAARALGYGAKPQGGGGKGASVVVVVPQKAADYGEWAVLVEGDTK
jgi:hypothetical protein